MKRRCAAGADRLEAVRLRGSAVPQPITRRPARQTSPHSSRSRNLSKVRERSIGLPSAEKISKLDGDGPGGPANENTFHARLGDAGVRLRQFAFQ